MGYAIDMEYAIDMGFRPPYPYLYYISIHVFFTRTHIPICILDRRLGDWFQFFIKPSVH